MKRRVSEEEQALLERAMRAVRPLKKRQADRPGKAQARGALPRLQSRAGAKTHCDPAGDLSRRLQRNAALPVSTIDRRTEQKLKRGRIAIDAVLDLHGMTQSAAHRRLNAFLAQAVAAGHGAVLVITGKGGARGDAGFMPADRCGVLREAVPRWIAEAPLCDLVRGLKPAGPRHGGQGALYVLLRKARKAPTR